MFEFGGRDGVIGKATIARIAPGDGDESIVSLDGLAELRPMVGFAEPRQWIKPLASPPDAPLVTAVIAAQLRSLGEKGALESATAWHAPESDLLVLEVRTIVAGTEREDYAGNAITGFYMFRWTSHDGLLISANTTTNYDGPETGDVHVIAVTAHPEHGLDLVLQWDRYEWEILEWHRSEFDRMRLKVRYCHGVC